MATSASGANVPSIEDLERYIAEGAKPREQFRLGLEHERVAVLVDDKGQPQPLPYDGPRGIEALLRHLESSAGWRAIEDHGRPIAVERGPLQITLEPGGQIEYSGSPQATIGDVRQELCAHYGELASHYEPYGIRLLGVGFNPYFSRDQLPWVPKSRYGVMRPYLAAAGTRGHDMMKRTATIQANVDYADERDAARKMRAAMGISALVTAMFANSPWAEGKATGMASTRAYAWLDTDNERCGLLPFVFDPEVIGGRGLFRGYVEWALDVPMFFVYRDGEYHSLVGKALTFRRYLADGYQQFHATLNDWVVHLSTLFPDVRLKRYLEVRSADSVPLAFAPAFAGLWKGLLYDDAATQAAIELTDGVSLVERNRLRAEVPAAGLKASLGKRPLVELARELLAIARSGLPADERTALAPLEELAAEGHSLADRLLRQFGDTPPPPAVLAK